MSGGVFFRPGLVGPQVAAPPGLRDAFGKGMGSTFTIADPAPRPFGSKGENGRRPQPSDNGGVKSAAGPMGSSVTTNELVAARFTPAIVSNPFQIRGTTTNKLGWIAFEIDRPMILKTISAQMKGVLYYHPERQPSNDIDGNNSGGHGVCYLSNPGRWFVKYAAGQLATETVPDNQTINVVLHDASDSAAASKYLGEPGTHYAVHTHVEVTSAVTPTLLIAGNVLRRAILIQTLIPSIAVRLGFDGLVLATGGAPAPNGPLGLRLGGTAGNSITLTNDTLVKGPISAILETGPTAGQIEIVEWI